MNASERVRIRDHAFKPCPTFGDAYCVHVYRNGRTCTWQERKHVAARWGLLLKRLRMR